MGYFGSPFGVLMENFVSSYVSSHKMRTFKGKGLTYNEILMRSFQFTYAGVVDIFIVYQRKKYILVCSGFTTDGVLTIFNKERKWRRQFSTLYNAIIAFHQCVQLITSSMDWFNEEYFNSCEFYNYADEELFK